MLSGPARAAQTSGPDPAVMATVEAALAAGTAGDVERMRSAYAADCAFIDEFEPFYWRGPGALDAWLASGARMYQQTGRRDGRVTVSPPAFVYVSGDRAFVVEPLAGRATMNGRPYAQAGRFAFTLARIEGRWKITSQTWTKARESWDPYRSASRHQPSATR